MAGDDTARRDLLRDAERPSVPDDPGPSGWPGWSTSEGRPGAEWPVYGTGSGRSDGIDDPRPVIPRRPRRGLLAAAVTGGAVVAALGFGVVLTGEPAAVRAPSDSRVLPAQKPVVWAPVWAPVDASLTAGLVRIRVTATVEADGMVMTDDGLVATSYARLVGLNGSAASIDAVELDVIADGGMPMRARLIGFDAARDVAVLRVPGYRPASVARLGTPVRTDDPLTLLDDQGDGQPIVGTPVTVTAVKQHCSRLGAAMISRPMGFQFPLEEATAEPGGAVVRDDGTVVGMYYGGDDNPRCAVPIADVAAVVDSVARGRQTSTTRVGPPGGLGIQLYGPDDIYPEVTSIDVPGGLANAAGVEIGDILTRVGDTSLRDKDLTTLGPDGVIRSLEPGQKVTIEWQSGGASHRASVVVGVGAQPNG